MIIRGKFTQFQNRSLAIKLLSLLIEVMSSLPFVFASSTTVWIGELFMRPTLRVHGEEKFLIFIINDFCFCGALRRHSPIDAILLLLKSLPNIR